MNGNLCNKEIKQEKARKRNYVKKIIGFLFILFE